MSRSLTLIAASAALSWVGAGASPLAFTRRAAAQIPGYDFTGCYTEATNMRALTGSSYFDDLMTVEKCANACVGFKYFGVEYGRECYCGNNINDGSVEAALADCSFACPGDSTETCGAGNRLDLYTRTTDPEVPTLTDYVSRGCYAEPSGARALAATMTRADDMTIDKCASFCGDAGYTLFGLEYYNECYCGHYLTPGAVPADAADCKFPCAGNSAELCGGDWRFNLYEFDDDCDPEEDDETSTTTSALPAATSGPATYTSEGCYTEAKGIRALSDVAYYDDAMTVEKCAAACAGYTWFGVEYGRECYGGNTIHSAEGSAPTSLAECSFPCPGNPTQKCGAGDRLNMYRFISSSVSTSTSTEAPAETSTSTAADEATSTTEPAVLETSTTSEAIVSTTAPEPTPTLPADDSTPTSPAAESTPTSPAAESTTTSPADDSTTTSPAAESTTTSPAAESTTTSPAAESTTTSSAAESTTTSSAAESTTTLPAAEPTTTSTTVAQEATTSTTTSSAAAATTNSPPPIVNAITNGGFEADGGWTIRTAAPGALSYSFVNPNDPHGGLRSASVSYTAGAGAYQAWISQPITLKANTRFLFSGWSKASSANPGCSITYYIGTNNGNQNLKTLATITSANLKPTWALSTGFYDATTITDLTFNVRWTCSGSSARTYYVDDLSLTAPSAA